MNHYHISYTAATHVGSRRRNEDNYLVNGTVASAIGSQMCQDQGRMETDRPQVVAVCDGIGGGAQGDTASLKALQTINDLAEKHRDLPPEELILLLADGAQKEVRDYFEERRSGGCTLSLVVLQGDRWAYLNIGDSPAFFWQKEEGVLTELSQRHNLEWEKRRQGEEPRPGDECCLMRYLGRRDYSGREMAHVTTGRWKPGDGVVVCSDGISNAFSPELLKQKMEDKTPADALVLEAIREPGADNSTAVLLWAEHLEMKKA